MKFKNEGMKRNLSTYIKHANQHKVNKLLCWLHQSFLNDIVTAPSFAILRLGTGSLTSSINDCDRSLQFVNKIYDFL